MKRFTHSSTFCTRVRESEMRDAPCWASLNFSITSTPEADWKAALSSFERLTCLCSITSTALSNAIFFDDTGFSDCTPAVCTAPESAPGCPDIVLLVVFVGVPDNALLTRAKVVSTAVELEAGLEGVGLGSLDDLSRRLNNGGFKYFLIFSSFPEGMLSQNVAWGLNEGCARKIST